MLLALLTALLLTALVATWVKAARARRAWEARSADDRRWSSKPSWESAGWTTGMIVLFGPIAVGIIFLVLTSAVGELQHTRTSALAALRTGTSVEGTFFLGSGRVDDKPVIRYVERQSDGAAVLRDVEAWKARIYEDAGDTDPRLDVYCSVLTNPWLTPVPLAPQVRCGYYFHVPAGSVLESYEVTP